jgi:hypothetical protein
MRLKVRVIYRGKSTIFDLPVGEGRHSIKWLGVTAAQRLAYSARSNGRRRKRDAGACTGLSGTNAQLMPSRVCTTHNPFLHPDKIICEELQDDEEVLVIISAGKPLDGIGCPVEDRWAMIAFFPSDQAAERRELALQEVGKHFLKGPAIALHEVNSTVIYARNGKYWTRKGRHGIIRTLLALPLSINKRLLRCGRSWKRSCSRTKRLRRHLRMTG